jgi:hypothetical protein
MASAIERDADWVNETSENADSVPPQSRTTKRSTNQSSGIRRAVGQAWSDEDAPPSRLVSPERVRSARRLFAIIFTVVLALLVAEAVILMTTDRSAEYEGAP